MRNHRRIAFAVGVVLGLAACQGEDQRNAIRTTSAPAEVTREQAAADSGTISHMDHSAMSAVTDSTRPEPTAPGAHAAHGAAAANQGAPAPHHARVAPGTESATSHSAAMAGMDHTRMAAPRTPVAPSTPGMDHHTMSMPTPRPHDHETGQAVRRPDGTPLHGGHAEMTSAPGIVEDDGTAKLRELVSALMRDPVVQQRVQSDPALRELWSNPAVQRFAGGGF